MLGRRGLIVNIQHKLECLIQTMPTWRFKNVEGKVAISD